MTRYPLWAWLICDLQVDLRFYAKNLTMTRISYLIIFLLFTVAAKAQVAVTASDTETCANTSVWIQASGADVYSWSPVANLDTAAGDSVNFSAAAGTYNITVYGFDTTLNDTDTAIVTIVVNPKPIVTIASSAAPTADFICLGDSAVLTASGSPSIVGYAWSPSGSLNVDDSSVVEATPATTTTYTLTVTDTNGCTNTQTRQVKVNPAPPSLVITVSDDSICPGQGATLIANGTGLAFSWEPAGSLNSTNTQTVIATPTTTTTYTVTVTTNACSSVGSVEIAVLPAPAMSYTQSSGGAPICLDEEDEVTLTCAECQYYIWTFPNSSLQTTSTVQAVSPDVPGATPVYVSGFGPNGCKTTLTVIVNVDSCFVGTPFGIAETSGKGIKVVQKGVFVNVSADDVLQSVTIFNLLGAQVMSRLNPGKTSISMNGAELPAGVYVVVAKTGSSEVVQKIYLN